MDAGEVFESDFGIIDSPGLGRCLGNHLKTKRWRYARHVLIEMGKKAPKEFICAKGCPACEIESALNNFVEKIWLTGGLVRSIGIDPPAEGTKPQDPRVKIKLGPIPEVPY